MTALLSARGGKSERRGMEALSWGLQEENFCKRL
jgi:hypothetical protein